MKLSLSSQSTTFNTTTVSTLKILSNITHTKFYLSEGDYLDCDATVTASKNFPGTAIKEMISDGYPQDKLLIGKPSDANAASNGYIEPSTLSGCVSQAKDLDWNGGVMVWEVSISDSTVVYQHKLTHLPSFSIRKPTQTGSHRFADRPSR